MKNLNKNKPFFIFKNIFKISPIGSVGPLTFTINENLR
jgi:hypothetical protein